jgi:hypothetical protein
LIDQVRRLKQEAIAAEDDRMELLADRFLRAAATR